MAYCYKPRYRKNGVLTKARKWQIVYVDENGNRRKHPGFTDKEASQALAAKIQRNIDRKKAGLEPTDSPIVITKTLPEAAKDYLAELTRRGVGARHKEDSKYLLNAIFRECKWQRVDQLSRATFAAFLLNLSLAHAAPRTMNRYQEIFRQFCDFCMDQSWLKTNPARTIKPAKVGQIGRRRRRRAYTEEEFSRLLLNCTGPKRIIYLTAALSGLRRSEIRRLQKCDFSPDGTSPVWTLRASVDKCGKNATLPMAQELAELLHPLWLAAKSNKPIFYRMVPRNYTLNADLKAAGIPRQDAHGRWLDFHSFRYFFCTRLAAAGLPIQHVARFMRHSTIKLTADLYCDLGLDHLAGALTALPALLPKPSNGQDPCH